MVNHRLQKIQSQVLGLSRPPEEKEANGRVAILPTASTSSPKPVSTSKVVTPEEAALLVKNGDWITVSGFVGTGCAEAVLNAISDRFDKFQEPRNLTLITAIVVGNGKGRGIDVLAKEGLMEAMVYAWIGTTPKIVQLIQDNKIKAWNFPFGCVAQMIRDVGAGRLGPLTTIGMGTFVDPRESGGKKNAKTVDNMVELVRVGGQLRLWYKSPKGIQVAVLRGTTADPDGNISFEKESLYLDQLNKAIAVHNSGGTVIVQVERICAAGSLPTRSVHIPGALVDKIVIAPSPNLHLQTFKTSVYDPSLSGELRAPVDNIESLSLGERKIIAHRAYFEISKAGAVVNLGVGMPEGVSAIAAHYGHHNPAGQTIVMTTEAGVMGGYPRGGLEFGTSQNASAHLTCSTVLDFYNGGGIDIAFLGMAQVDRHGNVNVSNFGKGKMPGCGGFIDISQSAKQVIFMGCHTSGGLQVEVRDGCMQIKKEGRQKKFCSSIQEKTFAASSSGGRPILYVTERAVFRLRPGAGLELIEVAPGLDIRKDVLDQMEFEPLIAAKVRVMDPRIFEL